MEKKVKYIKNKQRLQDIVAEADRYLADPTYAAIVSSRTKIKDPLPYKPRHDLYYAMARICSKEDIVFNQYLDRALEHEIKRDLGYSLPVMDRRNQWFQFLMPIKNWLMRKIKRKIELLGPRK